MSTNKAFVEALRKRGLRIPEPVKIDPAPDIQTRLALLEADLGIKAEKGDDDAAHV
jgi:hypothetical protein